MALLANVKLILVRYFDLPLILTRQLAGTAARPESSGWQSRDFVLMALYVVPVRVHNCGRQAAAAT